MTSVITTSITGVKSCKYQYFTERASRVLFGHNQPRSVGVIHSIETLHIELSYRVTPCIWSLIKRFISNIYRKVHWHGTTEKPKVRNGAGLFNIRVRTVSTSSHYWDEVYPALLYITAIQDGPSRVLRTLPITLWWHGYSAEKTVHSQAYSLIFVSLRMIIFFTSLMYREVIRASKEAEKPVWKTTGALFA